MADRYKAYLFYKWAGSLLVNLNIIPRNLFIKLMISPYDFVCGVTFMINFTLVALMRVEIALYLNVYRHIWADHINGLELYL